MRIRTQLALSQLAALALLLSSAGSANAAHLVLVDQNRSEEATPPESQAPGLLTCRSRSFSSSSVKEYSDSAGAASDTRSEIVSNDPTCQLIASATATSVAILMIQADPGESPGDPVSLCLSFEYHIAASSTGVGAAQAIFGGAPLLTDPLQVIRTPGNVVLFGAGPMSTSNDQVGSQGTRSLAATIGDSITLRAGAASEATIQGIGTALGTSNASLEIRLGSCPIGAPAASNPGLLGLAAALAGLGAVLLGRRGAQR